MGRGALLLAGAPLTEILVASNDGLLSIGSGAKELEEQPVTALSTAGEGAWAVVSERDVWRRVGSSWRTAGRASDVGVALRCVLSDDGGALLGASGARLFRLSGRGLAAVPGFDRVSGRGAWYTPWGGPPDTRSLARDVDGTVYANVHVGGIVRLRGERLEPTIDIDTDVHQVVAHPDRAGSVFAATAYGLASSLDGGDTWQVEDEGLHGSYCRAVAVAGDTMVVTASTGPFTRRAAVYRRPIDGGGAFVRCTEGLPDWFTSNIDTYCLAAEGDSVALATNDGAVYRSDDAGSTWAQAAEHLPTIHAIAVTGTAAGG